MVRKQSTTTNVGKNSDNNRKINGNKLPLFYSKNHGNGVKTKFITSLISAVKHGIILYQRM